MRSLLVSFVAAALLLPLPAAAAGKGSAQEGTCSDKAKAKRAFDAAHLAYRRGTYEEAILKFQDSYALCEKALTLLAIANAYERLGDLEAAVAHLEKYRPHAERRELDELDSRIEVMKKRIEEEKKEEQARKEEEDARRQQERRQSEEEAAERPLMWAGWITAAVGVAALAGGVVTGGMALSLDGDLADGCVDGGCPPDRQDDIDQLGTLSTATDVLLVLGGTLTAGGIAMLLLDQSSESSTSVGITLGPGLGGASLQGSF